jgi:hypothetical protein
MTKTWLYRVARFVDPQNILQFFESAVHQTDQSIDERNPVYRTHCGRLKASKYFHRLPDAKRDRKLWEQLHSISAAYKAYLCQTLIIEKLQADLNVSSRKKTELERTLNNLISQAACTYTTIERPGLQADMIINGDQSIGADVRDLIMLNSRL